MGTPSSLITEVNLKISNVVNQVALADHQNKAAPGPQVVNCVAVETDHRHQEAQTGPRRVNRIALAADHSLQEAAGLVKFHSVLSATRDTHLVSASI